MDKINFQNTIESKYSQLLISIILLFLLAPFLEKFVTVVPITRVFLFIIIMLTLRILRVSRLTYTLVILLGAMAISLEYAMNAGFVPENNNVALMTLLGTYIMFLGLTILFLTRNVFSEKIVTGDTIRGGISIYLLMGFWWVFLYYFIITVSPGAIISVSGEEMNLVRLYQYSFATLTTVGYGNIIPKSEFAITISNFEAVAGQVYLTVFIARLVGMYLFVKTKKGETI